MISLAAEVPQRLKPALPTVIIAALDLVVPGEQATTQALAAITAAIRQGPVYLHCALGYGRSAHVAAAWLQCPESTNRMGRMGRQQAQQWVRQRCPGALPELLSGGQAGHWPTGPELRGAGASQ